MRRPIRRACCRDAADDDRIEYVGDSGRDRHVQGPGRQYQRGDRERADLDAHQFRAGAHTVTVSYTGTSTNTFPNVFSMLTKSSSTTWPIAGTSTATSYSAPNINFYLLLDNSPSMAIAATTAGINTMVPLPRRRAAAPLHAMKPIHRPTAWETRRRGQLHTREKPGRGDTHTKYGHGDVDADEQRIFSRAVQQRNIQGGDLYVQL